MATLGVGPVTRMEPGGGRYYSKPRRRDAEQRKASVSSPSYELEQGAPIGAKKWLKSLFQAGAIHLSADRIAGLLGRRRKEDDEEREEEAEPGAPSASSGGRIYREAMRLEAHARVLADDEGHATRRVSPLVSMLVLGAAAVFLLTMGGLDALFGTRALSALLGLILY